MYVMRNIKQASRKNIEPNIAQKLPMLAIMKPQAEMTNSSHPIRSIRRLLILNMGRS